jgi:hypothetical protein
MVFRPAIRLLVALGAVAALAVPTTGHAETFRRSDATGDVDRVYSDTGDQATVPDHQGADIVRSSMYYGTSRIRITLWLREVPKTWFYIGRLQTPHRRYWLNGTRRHHRIAVDLESRNRSVDCAVHPRQDPAAGTITVTFAASCLDTPRWVRVGVFVMQVTRNGTSYADVALREGGSHASEPPLSPRIHRG